MRVALVIASLSIPVLFLPAVRAQQTQSASPMPQAQQAAQPLGLDGDVVGAKLIHKVSPVYPEIARTAHVSGTVVLHALIGKDGRVKRVKTVSGPALLIQAAVDAVRQWQYEPTLINGQPMEVHLTLSVVFDLSGPPAPTSQQVSGAAPSGIPSKGEPQSQATAPASPADSQLQASILKLLDVMHSTSVAQSGAKAMMQQLRPVLIASLPDTPHRDQIVDAYGDKLTALLTSQEATNRIAAIYAKYLSMDDVTAMIQFYQTPAGQHALTAMPQIVSESTQVGANLAQENLPRIFEDLCKEYPELQGKTKFCPAANQTKSSELIRGKPGAPADLLSLAGHL
jgi:TonB family protein